MLSGERPYRLTCESRRALEDAILAANPRKPSLAAQREASAAARGATAKKLARQLAGDWDTIILKALKKTVSERYATVQALRDDLERYLSGEPVLAQADSSWYRARKFVGRHRLETAAGALAVMALAGFALSLTIQLGRVTSQRDRADRLAQFMVHVFDVSNPAVANVRSITARDLLDKASRGVESGLTLDPEQRAQLIVTVGRSYTNLGAFGRSDALLRRELERATASLGPYHPQTMALGIELLWELDVSWQFAAAVAFGQELLGRQRRVLGPDHALTARTESYLMHCLAAMGRFDEAAEMGRHAVKIMRHSAAPGDLDLLGNEADVAYFRFRAGKGPVQEAEHLLTTLVEQLRAASAATKRGRPRHFEIRSSFSDSEWT